MSYTLTTRVADRVLARSIMHPGPHVTVVTDASSKLCPGFSGPTCVGSCSRKLPRHDQSGKSKEEHGGDFMAEKEYKNACGSCLLSSIITKKKDVFPLNTRSVPLGWQKFIHFLPNLM